MNFHDSTELLHKGQNGNDLAYGTTPNQAGESASAERLDRGGSTIQYTITGTSPKNEEGTLDAAVRFVRWLNRRDTESRSEPRESKQAHVDCESTNKHDETMFIQVTRVGSEDFFRELGTSGRAGGEVDDNTAAVDCKRAIERKCSKIPKESRGKIVLVLDTRRLPGHGFSGVRDRFRQKHGAWVAQQGFAGVYLVGPVSEMVGRLDTSASD